MQFYLLVEAFFRCIAVIFFQKQLRAGQTELINALLHIPHHKNIGTAEPLPGNTVNQGLLHQVAVLVFVNEYLVELAAQFVGHRTGPSGSCLCQDLQGKMLQIVKIDHIFFPLLFPEPGCKLLRQRKKHQDGLLPCLHVLQGFLR